jgi:uncharacterized integral membrane protein
MPYHHHHHHHAYYGGSYRRSPANQACSLVFCLIFLGIFLFIMTREVGFASIGYFMPMIIVFVLLGVGGIIAGIVNTARRRSQMQAQPVGSVTSPTGYPPQGGVPPQSYPPAGTAGVAAPQPSVYNPVTYQTVPQPRPVGIPQPQVQAPTPAPAIASRFCTYCGTSVEGTDQRVCANCGAQL